MSYIQPIRRPFDIGRVLSRTFSAIGAHWPLYLLAGAVLVGIPSTLSTYGQQSVTTGGGVRSWIFFFGGTALNMIGMCLLQGIVARTAVGRFTGGAEGAGNALRSTGRLILPIVALAILIGTGSVIGFIFLVIPGIYLTVIWSVAVPVMVIENRGVTDSLGRSSALTEGHRWSVLGTLIVLGLAGSLVGFVVGGIAGAIGGIVGQSQGIIIATLLATPLASIVGSTLGAAGAASMFHELKTIREGAPSDAVAAVFD